MVLLGLGFVMEMMTLLMEQDVPYWGSSFDKRSLNSKNFPAHIFPLIREEMMALWLKWGTPTIIGASISSIFSLPGLVRVWLALNLISFVLNPVCSAPFGWKRGPVLAVLGSQRQSLLRLWERFGRLGC
jgi:hypothetical protein